jgi:hypothetical protein
MRLSGALVLLLVVGCGGPASGQAPKAADVDPFAALRTVPLTMTQLTAGQPCAASQPRDLDPSLRATLGAGPVYVFNPIVQVGRPSKVAWAAAPTYSGPIRIRGRQIDGAGRLLLEAPDNRWRGAPVMVVEGSRLTPELDLLESNSTFPGVPSGWRIWPTGTYVANPGCYAWQVDGIGFRDVITIHI